MSLYRHLAAVLRKERNRQGITLTRMANDLNTHRQRLQNLEHARRPPSLGFFVELCEYLHLDPVEVLAHIMDDLRQR